MPAATLDIVLASIPGQRSGRALSGPEGDLAYWGATGVTVKG